MGEHDHGNHAERIAVSYWDAEGNETVKHYAADVPDDQIPELIDSPTTGLPAGRNKSKPPQLVKNEPYKTHLAYVKERRSDKDGAAILEEALAKLRGGA